MPSTAGENAQATMTPKARPDNPGKAPMWRALGLILLSAGLYALCAQGRPLPGLAWVALVPLFYLLHEATPWRGCLFAGLFGWLSLFTSGWWLYAPLRDIVGMPETKSVLCIMAGCGLMAIPYALAGAVICKSPRRGMIGAARNAAMLTAAVTWLTPVFQGNVAHTQYRYPALIQILELGGTPLLLFVILLFNSLLAEAVLHYSRNRSAPWKPVGAAVILFLSVLIYGVIRLQQLDATARSAPPDQWVTIGAVQPNIPIGVSAERQPAPNAISNNFFTALEQARELVRQHPEIDLLSFPENPATFLFNHDTPRRDALGKMITDTGKPVLLNADAFDPTITNGIVERYNVALLIDTNRNLAAHYPKMKRVPMVEYIPGETGIPRLRNWLPNTLKVLPGTGAVIFHVKDGLRVIPLICYEGTISSFTRQFVQKGGNIIVNQVNDSWFLRTPASEVHLSLTLFRTVEFRVPLVRVTNSGIGAHIQADGRIVPGSRTPLFSKAATAFPLYIPPHRSIYASIGNWWMLGLIIFCVQRRTNLKA